MAVPVSAVGSICVVSFLLSAYQYYRANSDRRVFNLRFGIMMGAVLLLLFAVFNPQWTIIWLPLALMLLVTAIYLLRLMPPPGR